MKKQIFIIILLLFGTQLFSQSKQQFKKYLKTTLEDIRELKPANVTAFDVFCRAFPETVLQEMLPLKTDTLAQIRSFRLQLLHRAATLGSDSAFKRQAVYELASACKDEDPTIRSQAAGNLKYYAKQYFSKDSKQQLRDILELDHTYYGEVVQLIAYLDMTEEIKQLEGLLGDTTHNDIQIKWKVHTALARLGSQESIDYCVNYAKSKDMNDLLVRFVLSDLAYIKQPETIGYLVSELYNDETNCRSANPMSSVKITCAYRIMELLAPVIKDFPYKAKYGTQLDASSYEQALQDIRQWFKENPDYIILKQGF